MRKLILSSLVFLASTSAFGRDGAALAIPSASPISVSTSQLHANYWIAQLRNKSAPILDARAIAAQNARLQQLDKSVFDMEAMPSTVDGATVRGWIGKLSTLPSSQLWNASGAQIEAASLTPLLDSLNLDAVPASQPARFGLVTSRASLRTFPTRLRVFSSLGDTDIDRFQESALFPGTPVLIVHESLDKAWWFIVSGTYSAWVEKSKVAEGSKAMVFGYGRKLPSLIVTGATESTVYSPEAPAVSRLQLDMGVRVPLLADWSPRQSVNGQAPLYAHVIQLPVRNASGTLDLVPALLPRSADVATNYLPLTRENLLRQAFKFLGERYGWGHDYDARDCSGFVSEVYRSFGIRLPRNTRDQGVSPALNRLAFTEASSREMRMAAVRALQVGDLIYIPGHVMMVIGFDRGQPYVIHDTTGARVRDAGGKLERVVLNGVSVTPLMPLMIDETQSYIDRMYSIQRIRP